MKRPKPKAQKLADTMIEMQKHNFDKVTSLYTPNPEFEC